MIPILTPTAVQLSPSLTWDEPALSKAYIARNSTLMMINPSSVPITIILVAVVLKTFFGSESKMLIILNVIKTLS